MSFSKIFSFFKNIFGKKNNMKMIDTNIKEDLKDEKIDFIVSLKENIIKPKKNKVKTLTCFGDGLGIQTKIDY